MASSCKRFPTHQTLARLAIALLLSGGSPPPVLAAMVQEPLAFDIPSGPLSGSLIEIGRRTGTIVSFSPVLVEGKTAEPVQGHFTPMQAFVLALSASGLSVDVTSNGTVTVLSAPAAMPATRATTNRPEPTAHEMPPIEQPVEDQPTYILDPVLVLASAEMSQARGLKASNASTATRSDTPLSELPQSVSVVTRDALDLQSPTSTTTDALRYVTGVTEEGQGMAPPSLMVRGLPALYSLSGMNSLRRELSIDSAFVERIEVLKGPSGVVGGIAEFGGRGGVVNLVRKSIETQAHADVTQSFSSRDSGTLRTDLDAAGQFTPGTTYWRAVAVGSRSGRSDSGHDPQHADGLLGVLGYHGADLKATLTLQTDRQRIAPRPASRGGMFRTDGSYTPVDPGQLGVIAAADGLHWRSSDIELDFDWRLSSQWHMTWKGRHERMNSDSSQHIYLTFGDEAAEVSLQHNRADAQSTGMQWGLIGDVGTGPMKHKLLVAVDLDHARSQTRERYAGWEVDPVTYQRGVTPLSATPDFEDSQTLSTRLRKRTVLMQDQIHLSSWIVRVAAQRNLSSESENPYGLQEPSITSWDAGLLHQIMPTVSVYAGTQYSAEADIKAAEFMLYDGTAARPRKLRQTQVGSKLELLNRRLALTLEAFRLRQLGTLQSSPTLPNSGAFILPGRCVDGVEAELSGRVSSALNLHLGVNVNRASDVLPGPDSAPLQGVEVPATGIPKRSLHLLARYQLPGAEPAHNSVGLAFRAYSSSWVVAPDPYGGPTGLRLPGGAQLDLSWTRANERWALRASIENLFDRQLYSTQSMQDYIPLLPRRSVGLSVTFRN